MEHVDRKSVDEKLELITRDLQEVLGQDGMRSILEERNLRVYWGTATTGRPHIAYFLPIIKLADFLSAGCEITVLLADLHAYLDNLKAPWLLLEHRVNYYMELITAMLLSINVPVKRLKFARGTEFQLTRDYMLDVYKLSTIATLHDCQKAGSEVVKQVKHPFLSAFLYPALQALDEEYLKVDAQFGGVDQRKIFVFAEKVLPQLGYQKRIHLMNPMLGGLTKGKMSSSDADSKIDLLDGPVILSSKIMKCFCEEKNVENNGALPICQHIIFPIMRHHPIIKEFTVEREPQHGGTLRFAHYADLAKCFGDGKLHPLDLKKAITSHISVILKPIWDKFERPEMRQLVELAYPQDSLKAAP